MVGLHHWLNGQEFEKNVRDDEGQGGLVRLVSMGSQRIEYNLAIEQQHYYISENFTELYTITICALYKLYTNKIVFKTIKLSLGC